LNIQISILQADILPELKWRSCNAGSPIDTWYVDIIGTWFLSTK